MPGLPFHHIIVHYRLLPWKHYAPVSEGLADSKSKYDRIECRPHEPRRIADVGTRFVRDVGTLEKASGV
jgi:hypothetical protein